MTPTWIGVQPTQDLSHFVFNGFDFRAAGLITKNPAAKGQMPPLRGSDVPFAGIPGQLFTQGKVHDARQVTLDFIIPQINQRSLGWPGIEAMLDLLAQLFGDVTTHDLTLYGADDYVPRTAQAYVSTWVPADQATSGQVYVGTVTFQLPDPYFYGPAIRVEGSFAQQFSVQIPNPGTVASRQIRLGWTGACVNPSVTNVTNGVTVGIADTVAEGQPLEIDCYNFAVFNAGEWDIGALSHVGDNAFMRLDPGPNRIEVAARSYGSGIFELSYRPAYL